jgi:L-fuconolactonase
VNKILRIDSHQHFWWLNRGDYHWLDAEPASIQRNFMPEDLLPLLAQAQVDKTVIVQAAETTEETDFILRLAGQYDFVAGVVGWIDMNRPSSLSILQRLSEHPQFLGIRPVIQNISDPDWMLKRELDPIFRWLIDHDLSFDALIKPHHLDNLRILLARYPELRLVIDHGAKPAIADLSFSPWAEKMQAIAENSQAFCKLSGFVTEAGGNVAYENIEPFMHHVMKHFGSHRLMWGSDWPVCTLAMSYLNWVAYLEKFLKNYSWEEQKNVWGASAQAFYQINQ